MGPIEVRSDIPGLVAGVAVSDDLFGATREVDEVGKEVRDELRIRIMAEVGKKRIEQRAEALMIWKLAVERYLRWHIGSVGEKRLRHSLLS